MEFNAETLFSIVIYRMIVQLWQHHIEKDWQAPMTHYRIGNTCNQINRASAVHSLCQCMIIVVLTVLCVQARSYVGLCPAGLSARNNKRGKQTLVNLQRVWVL